ncbi:MAG TPA: thiamine-phosphate kinase [Opitutaceae bacterium]|nr:thiamine-phosphate kinase [Opitutaceae bacterium]
MNPFTEDPTQSVGALGERRLIAKLREWLGAATPRAPFGIGDDCAVLPPTGSRRVLVTTDPVIYGRHFDDSISAAAAAEKLLKRNLSDIAAMGGTPRAAVVSLALPRRVSIAWIREFYRALGRCARRHQVAIAGGDIAESADMLGAFLTLFGEADGKRVLTRQGARAGDRIYVSGELGGSILGKHHRFTPRLAEGRWLAGRAEVRCLMDLSDGLAKDLLELTPPGLKPALDARALPLSRAAYQLARRDGRPAIDHALSDGEDFELLFALRAGADTAAFERAWRARFATRLTCVGKFARVADTTVGAIPLERYHGYEHLAGA